MSYIAARDAYLSFLTSLPKEQRRYRRAVAIDGSDVTINDGRYHVWLARDVESGEIMTFQASPDASAVDGARFLAGVATQCSNMPLLRLGEGPNRPRGLMNLDLYFQMTSPESIITRLSHLILGKGA